MRIVESKDKGFVLDLKLLFTIVTYFSGRFPSRFFTVKLVCFIDFPGSSYCERLRRKASLKKEIQVPFRALLFLGKWYEVATYFSLYKKIREKY